VGGEFGEGSVLGRVRLVAGRVIGGGEKLGRAYGGDI